MRLAAKTRVVHAVLVLAALWPLAQMALALRWDVSAWKLAGWGMYATPRFGLLGMEVYGRPAGGGDEVQLLAPSPALRDEATAFLERYRWLRGLAPRGRFVAAVFAEHPDWNRVRIAVSRPAMDARTGMVEMVHAEYAHPRE
jgi:hypothetical protein